MNLRGRAWRQAALAGLVCMTVARAHGYDYSLLPPMNGLASDFAERRAGKEVNAAIRIGVTNEGIYRISYSNLTNAGVATSNLVGSMMRLFCRTQEVAILVSSSNQWTASDYFLFPGTGFDGYYSITNVYWLGFGAGGKRMTTRPAAPIAGDVVTSYRCTKVHHEDNLFTDSYRWDDPSYDHWYDTNMTFQVTLDHVVTSETARLDAVMLGVTADDIVNPDHGTAIKINGVSTGTNYYDGKQTAIISVTFPGTLLRSTNTVVFQQTNPGALPSDVAVVERFGITFTRTLWQEGQALLFDGGPGANNYLVSGFAGSNGFVVLDTTDRANGVVLANPVPTNMGAGVYGVLFGDTTATTSRYAVCNAGGICVDASLQRVFFRGLADTNRAADYVVICPYEFRAPVYRLLALRKQQGLEVAVAPLPDIYNEFGYGVCDADAIKQFIGYACHHWKGKPRYVVLAGSGTSDPRKNRTDSTMPDKVPAHMGSGYGLWTALDGWFGHVNTQEGATGSIPNIVVGRLPVQTASQLGNIVDKIIKCEGVPATNLEYRGSALLIYDVDELGYDFSGKTAELNSVDLSPNGILASEVAPVQCPAGIVNGINAPKGVFIVNYFGHGAVDRWGKTSQLFGTNNVTSLTNALPPVLSSLTCVSGAFQSSKQKCLMQWLLDGPNRGAVACVAATGTTSLDGSAYLAHGFYEALLTKRSYRVGDAMMAGYVNLYLNNVNAGESWSFTLLGDPAMIVNP